MDNCNGQTSLAGGCDPLLGMRLNSPSFCVNQLLTRYNENIRGKRGMEAWIRDENGVKRFTYGEWEISQWPHGLCSVRNTDMDIEVSLSDDGSVSFFGERSTGCGCCGSSGITIDVPLPVLAEIVKIQQSKERTA